MLAGSDPRTCPGPECRQHHMFLRKMQESCSSSCELICFLLPRLILVSRHYGSALGLTQEPFFPSQDISNH